MATKVVNVDMDGEECSCELLVALVNELREELKESRAGSKGGTAISTTKRTRKLSAWQEHLSGCLKLDEVKKLPRGERFKKCSELYQAKKKS